MIIGTPDGRYYIRSWRDFDSDGVFETLTITEAQPAYVKHNCEKSQDYVVFRELTEEESKITPIFIY